MRTVASIFFVLAALTQVGATVPLTDVKTCYMLFGSLDDLGYTYAHNLGRLNAHKRLIQTYLDVNIESIVIPGAFFLDHAQVALDLVQRGCHVVHGTAPGFTDTMLAFAAQFPNVTFSLQNAFGVADGPPNLVLYASRTYNPWYIAGRVAAQTAKEKICFMAAWKDVPECASAVLAFVNGVVDEGAPLGSVQVLPMQSWYGPPRETLAAKALHEQVGCDVVAQYTDTFMTAAYAATLPPGELFALQMHGQANQVYGDVVLSCIWSDWTDIYFNINKDVIEGLPPSSTYVFSADVPRLCDISPLAATSTALFAANINMSQVQAFGSKSDSEIRNSTLVGLVSPSFRMHPDFVDYATCGGGQIHATELDTSTMVLRSFCGPCPVDTYTVDHIECLPCPEGLISDAGSSTCHVPPTYLDVGAVVGGVVASFVVLVGIFAAIVIYNRLATAALLRDNTFAPRTSPCGIVFTDIESSTMLWNEDPEGMAVALEKHNGIIRSVISKHECYEIKTIGDCFMIATPSAEKAVAVAVDIQKKITAATWPPSLPTGRIKLRVGVEFGPCDVALDATTKGFDYFGATVNMAARCEQAATGGWTVAPYATLRALDPAVLSSHGARLSEPMPTDLHGFDTPIDICGIIITGVTEETTLAIRLAKYSGSSASSQSSDVSTGSAHSSASSARGAAKYREQLDHPDVLNHPLVLRGTLPPGKYLVLRSLVVEVVRQLTSTLRKAERVAFLKDLGSRYGLNLTDSANAATTLAGRVLQSGHPQEILRLSSLLQSEGYELDGHWCLPKGRGTDVL
jgi:class 3 adenylate cyclase/basic membrane lipoprotein Med (substrate-binding protein (PBP1-ABC) superfamily)